MGFPRILVIDDDSQIREVVQVSLELGGGWTVLCASSGREGLDIVGRERLDAVLLDVMMPGLDGVGTLRLLRQQAGPALPVILFTARARPSERERLARLEVAGVIDKPFDPVTLAPRIAQMLGWEPGRRTVPM